MYNTKMISSQLSKIQNLPENPLALFKNLIERAQHISTTIPMNIATIDSEFGVLNRTVIYRGLIADSFISFVTERNCRKYQNLMENPKLSLSMLLTLPSLTEHKQDGEIWQIRLLNACAIELKDSEILAKLWQEEPLHAKIRSYICECGRPVDYNQLEAKHNELLSKYEAGNFDLKQTKTYTAFKILSPLWDFYKSEPFSIADRVQYREHSENSSKWDIYHVAA